MRVFSRNQMSIWAIVAVVLGLVVIGARWSAPAQSADEATQAQPEVDKVNSLTYEQGRVCVTGYDTNRPDDFPGLGDFIGWAECVTRAPNSDILYANSAGYWHVSFAKPLVVTQDKRESWPDFVFNWDAPRGGRVMLERSSDNGKTWSRPVTVYDGPLDERPDNIFVTGAGTILLFVNVQSSWYGFEEAPAGHPELNTRQLVLRSTDNGYTWSEPIWIESAGTFYARSTSSCIQLPDGGILWKTYDMDKGSPRLFGAFHRSDDDGKTWRVIATLRRNDVSVDEGDMVRLSTGRIVMVCRPDGGVYVSDDDAVTWERIGRMGPPKVKSPAMFVLSDDTIVCACTIGTLHVLISKDGGYNWTQPLALDPTSYGYPGGFLMQDESIFLSYTKSGGTPTRCYALRFGVNEQRDGIELLPIGEG